MASYRWTPKEYSPTRSRYDLAIGHSAGGIFLNHHNIADRTITIDSKLQGLSNPNSIGGFHALGDTSAHHRVDTFSHSPSAFFSKFKEVFQNS